MREHGCERPKEVMCVAGLDLRFRVASADLMGLPWLQPLGEWDATSAPLRDVPVGPSRHLVRFVEADGSLWALKELPHRLAEREYRVLREMEAMSLTAVRAAGLVAQPFDDTAILVTHYLERSWQYRRLLMRIPTNLTAQRQRLLWAISGLVVDLHRNGIYWGDCSLANTLFIRDGQMIQAWMVDAETAEIHPSLSDGQRRLDLDIMMQNVLGGLLDVATKLGEPDDVFDQLVLEAASVVDRYHELWTLLHEQPLIGRQDRDQMSARLHRLNDLGFAVDEVHLESADAGHDQLRMRVDVAGRRFHADQLRRLTGLDVGEGQARILLDDLRRFGQTLTIVDEDGRTHQVDERTGAIHWMDERFSPGSRRAHQAVRYVGSPAQAFCDLLEVRWLLSEQQGADVGDEPALAALSASVVPVDSAANLGFVDQATKELPAVASHQEAPGEPPRMVD
jgi:hypothetical protein